MAGCGLAADVLCCQPAGAFVGRLQLCATRVFHGVWGRCLAVSVRPGRNSIAAALGGYCRHLHGRFHRRPDAPAHHGAPLNVFKFIYFVMIVVAGTGGELCVSRAMKQTGEVKDFRPAAVVRVLLRALRIKWMWLGVGLMTMAFFSLLAVLSFEKVSFVVPVTALSYVAGALGGMFLLGERISLSRWTGIALVCVGVTLVFLGKG